MVKYLHEIRDPIHVFVKLTDEERKVVNSRPFQRLRHIHQLALTYLVYPGATHKRFEHSLGVMELASRVFDIVTNPNNISPEIHGNLEQIGNPEKLSYWRTILRVAALLHDVGHLPFSHAAERELLPQGWDHEKITREIILSEEMAEIWNSTTPPLRPEDIVKLAIGPNEAKDLNFDAWEAILSEIITGDAFGVDRMDYLLRDSYHTGVSYGRFDHFRLIDTLRILPDPETKEPKLGIEKGGLHSAEALLLARYFMYTQVYFHPIRRIYDIHLKDFLVDWLEEENFPTNVPDHLALTDNEVTSGFLNAARNCNNTGHLHAERIVNRKHFKLIYTRNSKDLEQKREHNLMVGKAVSKVLSNEFGAENFRHDSYSQSGGAPDFPVKLNNNDVVLALSESDVLNQIPAILIDLVFCESKIYQEANEWFRENRTGIIQNVREVN